MIGAPQKKPQIITLIWKKMLLDQMLSFYAPYPLCWQAPIFMGVL